MNTNDAIKNKLDGINKMFRSSIDDKTLFDDCFKKHIIHIERDNNCGSPKYKGRSIECPVYQKPFEYDVTKKFTKKSFESFKKIVNNCILLNALSDCMIYNKLLTEGFNKPDNIYCRVFTKFAHKKNFQSTELFVEAVKECNADINIYVVNVCVYTCIASHQIKYAVRVGTELKYDE